MFPLWRTNHGYDNYYPNRGGGSSDGSSSVVVEPLCIYSQFRLAAERSSSSIRATSTDTLVADALLGRRGRPQQGSTASSAARMTAINASVQLLPECPRPWKTLTIEPLWDLWQKNHDNNVLPQDDTVNDDDHDNLVATTATTTEDDPTNKNKNNQTLLRMTSSPQHAYPFALTLTTTTTTTTTTNNNNNSTISQQVYARLMLCDATWPLAACQPLVDVDDWMDDNTDNNDTTDTAKDEKMDDDEDAVTADSSVLLPATAARQGSPWITTPFVSVALHDNAESSTTTIQQQQQQQNVTLQFPSRNQKGWAVENNITAGLYHLIVHVKVVEREILPQTEAEQSTTLLRIQRWDVAAALYDTLMEIQNAPIIRSVSEEAQGIVLAVSILCSLYALMCLVVCVRHRDHAVLKLAQAPFLIVLVTASLWSFATLFVVLPTQDWHCQADTAIVMTPLALVTVILNARLWRVYQTLSVVGQLGRQSMDRKKKKKKKNDNQDDDDDDEEEMDFCGSCCNKLCCCCRRLRIGERIVALYSWLSVIPLQLWDRILECKRRCQGNNNSSISPRMRASRRQSSASHASYAASSRGRRRGPNLRKAVTAEETWSLIVMLMLPHLIVTIVALFVEDQYVVLEFDAAANQGRYVCGDQSWSFSFTDNYIGVLEFFSLVLAWMSRHLPSAFNEKNQLFQVAGLTIVINIAASILAGDVSEPSSNPNAWVGVYVTAIVIRILLILLLIVQPKVNRVWSGEKVIVSNLLREHNGSETSSENRSQAGIPTTPFGVNTPFSGASPSPPNLPRVILQKDDPLPRKFEVCMYELLDVLRNVTRRVSEGRPLRLSDWDTFRKDASDLYLWMERIELDWGADAEPITHRSLPMYNADDDGDGTPASDGAAANGSTPPENDSTSKASNDECAESYPPNLPSIDESPTDDTDDVEQRLARRLMKDASGADDQC